VDFDYYRIGPGGESRWPSPCLCMLHDPTSPFSSVPRCGPGLACRWRGTKLVWLSKALAKPAHSC